MIPKFLLSALTFLALGTGHLSTTAWAQGPSELRISCRFELGRGKDRDRFCTAKFTYFFNRGPEAQPAPPTYRVECDEETIFRGGFAELTTTLSPTGEPGMSVIYADRGPGFPVVYLDGLPRRDGFEWAPADLLLDRDRRPLHGRCERL